MKELFDWVIIGAGPGGQKAAICAAKAGLSVAIIEREAQVGGACVHRGTIPSKTLRESAMQLQRFFAQADEFGMVMPSELRFSHVRGRLDRVIDRHVQCLGDQLTRNGVVHIHGAASFVGPHDLEVRAPGGTVRMLGAERVVIATGSRPRQPPEIEIDHESVLDSDSVLGIEYLPHSMVILGGGIIACEYASIFASLGVLVTLVDRGPRPLAFLDEDLSLGFLRAFEAMGGRYYGERRVLGVERDGSSTVTQIEGGATIAAEKVLVALGRVPATASLRLEAAGVVVDTHGRVPVDANCCTSVPHIYAVGDVIGPPALASWSMEQGRRAVMHALGKAGETRPELVPMGIFTIPELACVGESETTARARYGEIIVGRADFSEIARGHIAGEPDGMLKLVADATGERLLGVGVVGEGATELVHLGMMVLLGSGRVREFIDNCFNFPTMAEAYRVAALDVLKQAAHRGDRRAA
jgi:NAD(P) transhydrogenase